LYCTRQQQVKANLKNDDIIVLMGNNSSRSASGEENHASNHLPLLATTGKIVSASKQ
jgi:hypothetical protein